MIIVNLMGGLGNQMFQYACGRALSLRNGEPMKLDATGYESSRNDPNPLSHRDYLLSHFDIQESFASPEEIRRLKYRYGILSKIYRRIRFKLGYTNVSFNPSVLRKKGDLYLDGFWQSESYFKDKEDAIRSDLKPRNSLGPEARAMLETISRDPGAISVHIRRGDNAYSPASMKFFGMPPSDYPIKAIAELSKRLAARGGKSAYLHAYVFSDEIEWVKANLDLGIPATLVSKPGIADWEEISIMAACRHHVIANSTFSWWGAWLDPRADKIVIAPKHWANMNAYQFKDIIPSGWIRI